MTFSHTMNVKLTPKWVQFLLNYFFMWKCISRRVEKISRNKISELLKANDERVYPGDFTYFFPSR